MTGAVTDPGTGSPEDPVDGERRAWGWVAHLRDGGTTPWRDWTGRGPADGRLLPGAQQLELLRRLNLAGSPGPDLADRVLAASAPGRGRPDLELAGAVRALRFGPAPVDPGDLPDDELIRVATSVLADDVVAEGAAHETAAPQPLLVRPWRPRYRLVGDPWLTDPARSWLVARGRPPGGRRPTVLVLATDLETMLVHAWTSRAFSEGGPEWRPWLEALVRRDLLAPRVDVVAAARTWRRRVGRSRVRVVTDPAALPRLVGVRRALPRHPDVSADGTDLARRLAAVLGLLVPPARRRELLEQVLLPRLAAAGGPGLAIPEEHAAWVRARAARVRDDLAADGYPVSGDLAAILPAGSDHGVPARERAEPSEAGVLDLAVRLLLGADRSSPGRSGPDREEER